MSIFTNKTNWIIGFLILLNCITLGLYWFSRGPGHLPPPRANKGLVHFLSKELNLSDEQTEKLQIAQQAHRSAAEANLKNLHKERRDIIEALTSENPDTSQALQLAQSVGDREEQMQLLLIQQYQTIWEMCDAQQREKLRKVFKESVRPPKDRPRPGREEK
jgi:Spy/CpxP family protein refolding chaperone